MHALGWMLTDGDPAAARLWYERTADTGSAHVMYRLGLLLQRTISTRRGAGASGRPWR